MQLIIICSIFVICFVIFIWFTFFFVFYLFFQKIFLSQSSRFALFSFQGAVQLVFEGAGNCIFLHLSCTGEGFSEKGPFSVYVTASLDVKNFRNT